MSRDRRIAALQALAERPGTPEEGLLAQDKLEALKARHPEVHDPYADLRDIFRRHGLYDQADAIGMPRRCNCGAMYPYGGKCAGINHANIQSQMRTLFPKGLRVRGGEGDRSGQHGRAPHES